MRGVSPIFSLLAVLSCGDASIEPLDAERILLDAWTTFELAAVAAGTRGTVRTVIEGTEPVELAVRFVALAGNPITGSGDDPYLLMETDPADARWRQWGGVAAGMSGSPVFVDGRLAGALSYSVAAPAHPPYPFLATPIANMLRLGDDSHERPATGTTGVQPLASVLAVRGPSPGLYELHAGWDERLVAPAATLDTLPLLPEHAPARLQPGGAIAVQLVRGPALNMDAIGTVTAIDGDRVWAFGHPFLWSGAAQLPFRAAAVHGITSWGSSVYKLGAPVGPELGTIDQDRMAGIRGVHGVAADAIQLRTRIEHAGVATIAHEHRVTRVPWLDWMLVETVASSLTLTRDAFGPGAARYRVTATIDDAGVAATTGGYVSSSYDLAWDLAWLLQPALFELTSSPLDVHLRDLAVEIEWFEERRELTLTDLDAPYEVHSGEPFVVTVSFSDRSGQAGSVALTLTAPPALDWDSSALQVGAETALGVTAPAPPASVADLVANFNARPRPHVLRATLLGFDCGEHTCVTVETSASSELDGLILGETLTQSIDVAD